MQSGPSEHAAPLRFGTVTCGGRATCLVLAAFDTRRAVGRLWALPGRPGGGMHNAVRGGRAPVLTVEPGSPQAGVWRGAHAVGCHAMRKKNHSLISIGCGIGAGLRVNGECGGGEHGDGWDPSVDTRRTTAVPRRCRA